MIIWAIIPVKPLRRAKSRLSTILTKDERAALSQDMLIHTLDVLAQNSQIERCLVVSRDSRALALARAHHARTVTERGSPQLNPALIRATLLARRHGASGIMVIPADLPLLNDRAVDQLIERASDPPVMVIAPDRHQDGTNALLLSPPGLIEYDFGLKSFERHLSHAKAVGARIEILEVPELALDIDTPEDYEILQGHQWGKTIKTRED